MEFKDYTYTQNSSQECPICFEIMENALVRETPCGHIFHVKCIKTQFANVHYNRFCCSMCRNDLFNYIPDEELSEYSNEAVDLRYIVQRSTNDTNLHWGSEIVESLIDNSQPFYNAISPSSSETSEDSSLSNENNSLEDEGVLGYLSSLWTRIFGNRDEDNQIRIQERAQQRAQQWARQWSLEQQRLRSQQNRDDLSDRLVLNSPPPRNLIRYRTNIHTL